MSHDNDMDKLVTEGRDKLNPPDPGPDFDPENWEDEAAPEPEPAPPDRPSSLQHYTGTYTVLYFPHPGNKYSKSYKPFETFDAANAFLRERAEAGDDGARLFRGTPEQARKSPESFAPRNRLGAARTPTPAPRHDPRQERFIDQFVATYVAQLLYDDRESDEKEMDGAIRLAREAWSNYISRLNA